MWTGFGKSVNTWFVPLEEQVGADKVVDVAKRLGVQFRARSGDKNHPLDYEFANEPGYAAQWGAFTLGVSAATPLDMANAYATVVADGLYCEPLPVVTITDYSGNKLDAANPRCKQAISVEAARGAADAARCPVGDQSTYGKCAGTTAQATKGIVGKPVAGKTGTTDGDKTAALIVMTRDIAVAGIIADPDNPFHSPYSHNEVNAAVAYTVKDFMKNVKAPKPFIKPNAKTAFGDRVTVPPVQCFTVAAAQAAMRAKGLDSIVGGGTVPSPCPAGTVASTTPSGTTAKNSTVTLNISGGGGRRRPRWPRWARRTRRWGRRRRRGRRRSLAAPSGVRDEGRRINSAGPRVRRSYPRFSASQTELPAYLGGHPTTLGPTGDRDLGRLHRLPHGGPTGRVDSGERCSDDPGQFVVAELPRQVPLQHLLLGPLLVGHLGATGVGERGRRFPTLLRLPGEDGENCLVVEFTGLRAGHLGVADGGDRHPQGGRDQVVAGLHGAPEIGLQPVLQRAHG